MKGLQKCHWRIITIMPSVIKLILIHLNIFHFSTGPNPIREKHKNFNPTEPKIKMNSTQSLQFELDNLDYSGCWIIWIPLLPLDHI